MAQLPPGNAPGLPYNSLQTGTVVAFAVTYGFCTFFLALRYIQAVIHVKKVELDLGKPACSGPTMRKKVFGEAHTHDSHPHAFLWRRVGLLCYHGHL